MKIKWVAWAMLLIVALFIAGCSAAGALGGSEAKGAAPQGETVAESQEGAQTMVGEVGLGGDLTPPPDEFVEGHVVDSTGEEYSGPQSSAPSGGGATGAFPGQADTEEESFIVASTYTDPEFGFSVGIPANIVVMEGDAQVLPVPLAQVYFLDQTIANSEFATMQPPELAIRIYANAQGKSVERWLSDEGVLARFGGQSATIEPFTIGGLQGVRVTSMLMLAPNSAIFVSGEGVIYELQPLGYIGEQMMITFQP